MKNKIVISVSADEIYEHQTTAAQLLKDIFDKYIEDTYPRQRAIIEKINYDMDTINQIVHAYITYSLEYE